MDQHLSRLCQMLASSKGIDRFSSQDFDVMDLRVTNQEQPFPSILEFHWGNQVLPVLMTQVQFAVKAYLPNLVPYRAEATLTLQIIQSDNEFYTPEIRRVFNSATQGSGALQGFQNSGS